LYLLPPLLLTAAPVWAHHAFAAEFDGEKPVKFKGTVTRMEWINPHAWIHIDVKRDDGKVTSWMIEAAAPNALLRRGWSKNSLPAGTEILVEGFQAEDGTNLANGSVITFTDGKKLFVGSSAGDPGAAPGAPKYAEAFLCDMNPPRISWGAPASRGCGLSKTGRATWFKETENEVHSCSSQPGFRCSGQKWRGGSSPLIRTGKH
jgi:hypothetical protein